MWKFLIGSGISLGLLAVLVLWGLEQQTDWTAPAAVAPGAWAVLLGALLISYALRASRQHLELSSLAPVGWWQILRISLVHNMMVNALPMRAGELAYPWLLRRQVGIGVEQALVSLVWLRMQDLFVLGAFALCLLPPWPWTWRLALLLLAVALGWAGLRSLERPARRWVAAGAAPATGWRASVRRALALLLSPEKHQPGTWLYCVANWATKLGGIALFLSWSLAMPLAPSAAGAVGGELGGLWPVQGPAGLGTYEAAVWLAVRTSLHSLPPDLPAMVLALHAVLWLQSIALGALAHVWNLSKS